MPRRRARHVRSATAWALTHGARPAPRTSSSRVSGSGVERAPAGGELERQLAGGGQPEPEAPDQVARRRTGPRTRARVHDRAALQRDDAVGADDLVHLLGHVDDGEALGAQAARPPSSTSARPAGSSMAVGSSSTSTRRGTASTPASAVRCFWPPESRCGSRVRSSVEPEPRQHLVDPPPDRRPAATRGSRGRRRRRPRRTRPPAGSRGSGTARRRRGARPCGPSSVRRSWPQATATAAPGGLLEAAEQARERRLAGAVGADDGDELARGHREVEPGERVDGRARVPVAQAADRRGAASGTSRAGPAEGVMTAEAYRIAAGVAGSRDATLAPGAAGRRVRLRNDEGREALRPPALRPPSSAAGRQTSSMYACSLPSPGRGPSLMMRV